MVDGEQLREEAHLFGRSLRAKRAPFGDVGRRHVDIRTQVDHHLQDRARQDRDLLVAVSLPRSAFMAPARDATTSGVDTCIDALRSVMPRQKLIAMPTE
jgi:hypothetical protein